MRKEYMSHLAEENVGAEYSDCEYLKRGLDLLC